MTRFREKKDPARTLTWLSSLTFEENDKIYVQAVSGVSGMVGERIAEWSTDQLQDTLSTDEWVEVLQRMAQDHCDATQARGTYRLVHERGDVQRSFFLLRLEPATSKSADGGAGLDGDEDPSVEGQLRSLMAHQRMTMSMALKTPMMVIEMLMKQLAMSNERIAELERERADHLDTYATALELAATAETKQNQSVPEQVEAWTKVVPELAKSVPLLVSGIKAIVKL
jgi:hypothetical protein